MAVKAKPINNRTSPPPAPPVSGITTGTGATVASTVGDSSLGGDVGPGVAVGSGGDVGGGGASRVGLVPGRVGAEVGRGSCATELDAWGAISAKANMAMTRVINVYPHVLVCF